MKVLNTYILCLLASVLTLSCSLTKNNEVSSNENNKFPPPPPPALADGYYGELTNYNHIKGWVNIVNFEDVVIFLNLQQILQFHFQILFFSQQNQTVMVIMNFLN